MKGYISLRLLIKSEEQARKEFEDILQEIKTQGDGANYGYEEADWDFMAGDFLDVYDAADKFKNLS
jgi:hypothetical protein